ncbi:hypothetical protein FB561_4896 [Kribbella amoyensis]|uniref:Uncharacterized protein n=1 Tax=Kribbella amoyensis TaxID=996641 RepID=A0A561BXY4_9ACTN|nr:hypothetical protein [Kribbella amoyensis]TWD83727.1 hypothetical protein FB561_4896 [Kribbella amoyensis]
MNNKRDKDQGGASNPWVRKTDSGEEEAAAPEQELPPSPWSLEVPPRPSPWTDGGAAGGSPGTDSGWGRASTGSGAPESGWGDSSGSGGPSGGGPSGSGSPGGPATESSSAWGEKVGPPSLRRPPPAKKKPSIPPLVIPIAAGVAVVALVAVALVLLTGGDDTAKQEPSPSVSVTTPPASSYTPPANAVPVEHGVSVVPVNGWSVLAKETKGKQLVTYAPNGEPRAFFWVRQKLNTTARTFLLGIVEGETENEIAQLGNVRNLPCPRDVLVECVAITYTSTANKVKVQGYVEAYRRKDGVVTALDFRSRSDYAAKAEAEAAPMKQSVVDSL